jgi:hypothetical protein
MPRLGGMNARDVRMLLANVECDPRLKTVLAGIAERQDHLFHLLGSAAEGIDRLATMIGQSQMVMGKVMKAHDDLVAAKRAGVTVASESARDQQEESGG